jgi:hypothetical protein
VTLPVKSLKLLKDDKGFRYVLGHLGETVVAHYYELTERRVYSYPY